MSAVTDPSAPAVRARELVLAHGDHVAIDRTTVDLPAGGVVAVIGPNGSGKSSFLDAVAGLLAPAAGSIEVFGAPPGRAELAYVFQRTEAPAQLPLTVREVVTMGRYSRTGLLGRVGEAGRTAVRRALERVGMAQLADRQLLELSGGQRQRALVAQGLAAEASMLLLDEPMTGLDLVAKEQVLRIIFEERDAGRTVMFSTHDLAEAAAADTVVLLAGGLVAAGPPAHALAEEHLREAYRGRLIDLSGVTLLDDPHHHGEAGDRHDGHVH